MKRPVLVYDGECGFCRLWIERWKSATAGRVEFAPYQSAAARHPEVAREAFAEAVHFFEPSRTTRAAEAALRALSYGDGLSWLPRLYALPGVPSVAEAVYRFVAARRPLFSRLTRLFYGESPVVPPVERTSRLFMSALGVCYLAAFVSLGVQVRGLVGSDGLLPAAGLLDAARAQLGPSRFWLFPTVFWAGASDAALSGACWLGAALSLGLVAGVAAGPCALACWTLYLSLCAVGGDFLSFQWDALLLEAGLISILLPAWRRGGGASRGALWLLRLLLVKLMLQSALVKLLSGDESWRGLTALTFHYWSQPLPTPAAWWFDRAPLWFHKASCVLMFLIELAAPALILLPRRARALGAGAVAFLMLVISLTGNYGFFNLLTLALCVACLDDRFLRGEGAAPAEPSRVRSRLAGALAALTLTIALFETAALFSFMPPEPARRLIGAVSPLRSFNRYGLFAVMTKARDEVALEVSADGREWREWPFRWKPGDERRAPPWAGLHMPRLDWQMWFAALGTPTDSPWIGNLAFRLLEGRGTVERLLGPRRSAAPSPPTCAPSAGRPASLRRAAPGGRASAAACSSPSSPSSPDHRLGVRPCTLAKLLHFARVQGLTPTRTPASRL
ncbi:MAG: lipase maturation factor family protein [Elusimicrobiota bacterium]|nr:MAG: lipase maturation factor family protein [Elusimicrobiota bacterium]